jgi:hypothetical protein
MIRRAALMLLVLWVAWTGTAVADDGVPLRDWLERH